MVEELEEVVEECEIVVDEWDMILVVDERELEVLFSVDVVDDEQGRKQLNSYVL